MTSRRTQHVLLIGCGLAARHNYVPVLERLADDGAVQLSAVVDLASVEPDLVEYFSHRRIKPETLISVSDETADERSLAPELAARLDRIVQTAAIDAVFILTEPKAHLAYLEWAVSRELRVLIEKPIHAPVAASLDRDAAREIVKAHRQTLELLERYPRAQVTVMVQRRYHEGYEFLHSYLSRFVEEFQIPISYVGIGYSDGEWRVGIDEFLERRNHPLNRGYGVLLHGGYHPIDLLSTMVQVNDRIPAKRPESFSMNVRGFRPSDLAHAVTPSDQERLLGKSAASPVAQFPGALEGLGELDCYALMQFMREGHVVTTAQLSIQHNGFSRRAWSVPNADTYRKNGRVRHEHVVARVGPLLSVQVHSYEAWESDAERSNPTIDPAEVGGSRHFDVEIFRNAGAVGGRPLERVSFGGAKGESAQPMSLVQAARGRCIAEFLSGVPSRSDIRSHCLPNLLLSSLCEGLAAGYREEYVPIVGELPGSAEQSFTARKAVGQG